MSSAENSKPFPRFTTENKTIQKISFAILWLLKTDLDRTRNVSLKAVHGLEQSKCCNWALLWEPNGPHGPPLRKPAQTRLYPHLWLRWCGTHFTKASSPLLTWPIRSGLRAMFHHFGHPRHQIALQMTGFCFFIPCLCSPYLIRVYPCHPILELGKKSQICNMFFFFFFLLRKICNMLNINVWICFRKISLFWYH